MNAVWTRRAVSMLDDAATTAVGILRLTSSAWLGPDRVTTCRSPTPGKTSLITSDIVIMVPTSTPLATFTMAVPEAGTSANFWITLRRNCDGTASTIISAPWTASARSAVTLIRGGISIPGRNRSFLRVARICRASSSR